MGGSFLTTIIDPVSPISNRKGEFRRFLGWVSSIGRRRGVVIGCGGETRPSEETARNSSRL